MGKRYTEISEKHQEFIKEQKIFFVGTAGCEGRVNVSPKGIDSLRVMNANRIVWLNITGSANETSAHVQENGRMTLMFNAFEGNPLILRVYGQAKVIHRNDSEWEELIGLFPPFSAPRQVFDLRVDLVQSSCGFGVPLYDYVGQREELTNWADKKSEEEVVKYWEKNNAVSLDGKPTYILEKSLTR